MRRHAGDMDLTATVSGAMSCLQDRCDLHLEANMKRGSTEGRKVLAILRDMRK